MVSAQNLSNYGTVVCSAVHWPYGKFLLPELVSTQLISTECSVLIKGTSVNDAALKSILKKLYSVSVGARQIIIVL